MPSTKTNVILGWIIVLLGLSACAPEPYNGSASMPPFLGGSTPPDSVTITSPATSPYTSNTLLTSISGSCIGKPAHTIEMTGTDLFGTEIQTDQVQCDSGSNSFTFTITDPGNDGQYTYSFVQIRNSNQVSSFATSMVWNYDSTPPGNLGVNSVVSPTSLVSQDLIGTKDPNSSIWIDSGAGAFEAVASNTDNTWAYTVYFTDDGTDTGTPVEQVYTYNITSRDALGNETSAIPVSIELDQTPPADPAADPVTSPTNVRSQVITGTKEANSSILFNGVVVVPVDDQTTWSHTVYFTTDGSDTGLEEEKTYNYNITSRDNATPKNVSGAATISITFDKTAPAKPVLSPVTSPTSLASQVISGTMEAGASVLVNGSATGVTTSGSNWSYTASFTTSGTTYTYDITAADGVGNVSAATTASIKFDNTPPSIPVPDPVTSPTNVRSQTISGTKEANSSILFNGAVVVPRDDQLTWSYEVFFTDDGTSGGNDQDGLKTYVITSKDDSNPANESTSVSVSIDFDGTEPTDPVITPPYDPVTNQFSQTINGTKEADSAIYVDMGGGPVLAVSQSASESWSYTVYFTDDGTSSGTPTDGTYNYDFSARDAAGNISLSFDSATILYDGTGPGVTLTAPPASTAEISLLIGGTYSDNNPGTTVSVSSDVGPEVVTLDESSPGVPSPGDWHATVSLNAGDNTITVSATDAAGNTTALTPVIINSSTVKPNRPTVITPAGFPLPPLKYYTNARSLDITAGKVVDTSLWLDGNEILAWGTETSHPFTVYFTDDGTIGGADTEGEYTYSMTVKDGALPTPNESDPRTMIIVFDTTAPTEPGVTVNPYTNQDSQVISGTKDADASIWVDILGVPTLAVDGAVNTTTSWTYTVYLTDDGTSGGTPQDATYAYDFTAKDKAGNMATAPTVNITRDKVLPTLISFTSAPPALTNAASVVITGTTEPYATVLVNGSVNVNMTYPDPAAGTWSFTANLTNGITNNYTFRAKDRAGNLMDPANTISAAIERDSNPPVIAPINITDTLVNPLESMPTISGNTDEPATVVVNGTTVATLSTTWSYLVPSLSPGTNTFTIEATDEAGNLGTASADIEYDNAPPADPTVGTYPATKLTTVTIGGNKDAYSSILVNGVEKIGAADANITWSTSVTLTTLNGDNTFDITSRDAAGNISGTVQTTITHDNIAPALTITSAGFAIDPAAIYDYVVTSATSNLKVTGTCEAGLTVSLTGNATGSSTCAAFPTTGITINKTSNGTYTFTFSQTDVAGNTGSKTLKWTRISPSVSVSPSSLTITEKNTGSSGDITVALGTRPDASVQILVQSMDTSEVSMASVAYPDPAVSQTTVTFTQSNWDTPQTVTIYGYDDQEADGNRNVTVKLEMVPGSDTLYNTLNPADVLATVLDSASAGLTLSKNSLLVKEGGVSDSFTVRLNTQPTDPVTVNLTFQDITEAAIGDYTTTSSTLTFTSADWITPQTVTVNAKDDADLDGTQYVTLALTITTTDLDYNGLNPDDVYVTVSDNDLAGVTLSPFNNLQVMETGGVKNVGVMLNTSPNADVTMNFASLDTGEVQVSPSSLTFNSGNWNVAQYVALTGQDDLFADNDQAVTVVVSTTSTATGYSAYNPPDLSVTVIDNEVKGYTVLPTTGLRVDESGTSAIFTVTPHSQPQGTGEFVLNIQSSDLSEVTVDKSTLKFTYEDWMWPQTVTVTGQPDALADGNQTVTISITTDTALTTDDTYDAVNPPDVIVINSDNNTPGFTVQPTTLVTREDGTNAHFHVALNTQPQNGDVYVVVQSQDTGEVIVDKSTLVFTVDDWTTPQVVNVTGVDDGVSDGNQQVVVAVYVDTILTSATSDYFTLDPPNVTVTNMDTSPAITLYPSTSLVTSETDLQGLGSGTSDSFFLVLNSQPTSAVRINLTDTDTLNEQVVISTPSGNSWVEFTTSDWATPQEVVVTGINEAVIDGNQTITITLAIDTGVTTDLDYSVMTLPAVTVVHRDDETKDIVVSPTSGLLTSESGQTDSFEVVLTNPPLGNVIVSVASLDLTEVAVDKSCLVFTTDDWMTPQTITVTGVNDTLADLDILVTVEVAIDDTNPCGGFSWGDGIGNYDQIGLKTTTVTNRDNEPRDEGTLAEPADITGQLPYPTSITKNGDSYYYIHGLTPSSPYILAVYNLTDVGQLEAANNSGYLATPVPNEHAASSGNTTILKSVILNSSQADGEFWMHVYGSASSDGGAGYDIMIEPVPTDDEGIAGAPVVLDFDQPYFGHVSGTGATNGGVSYYKLTGLSGSTNYFISAVNTTQQITLEVYNEPTYTIVAPVISEVSVNPARSTDIYRSEAVKHPASAGGELYIKVINNAPGTIPGIYYTLKVEPMPVLQGTIGTPIVLGVQNLPYNLGQIQGVGPVGSYYMAYGLVPGISYVVSISQLTADLTFEVFELSNFSSKVCTVNSKSGKQTETCSAAANVDGKLYIKVSDGNGYIDNLGGTFRLNVQ